MIRCQPCTVNHSVHSTIKEKYQSMQHSAHGQFVPSVLHHTCTVCTVKLQGVTQWKIPLFKMNLHEYSFIFFQKGMSANPVIWLSSMCSLDFPIPS